MLSLYRDLLDFCSRIVRFHGRSFRSAFIVFDKEFSGIADAIDLHSREVERAAAIAGYKEAKEARDQMFAIQRGKYDCLPSSSESTNAIADSTRHTPASALAQPCSHPR